MCCKGKKIVQNDLINYLNNEYPNLLTEEKKKILTSMKVFTLHNLHENLLAQERIFTPLQEQNFKIRFGYTQPIVPLNEMKVGNTDYIYKLSYPQDLINNGRKVMVIGIRGSGKSSFINALTNALLIGYPDNFRYHIADYDINDKIQVCDLIEKKATFQFLEVPGYGNDENNNQEIMKTTYAYLNENNIAVDLILLCRKNSTSGLDKPEKQIIMNLSEIFGKDFVTKFLVINTNSDMGQQHIGNLEKSLQSISTIYSKMPDPKILFVNSNTTPLDGEEGNARYQTVVTAKDSSLNILDTIPKQLMIKELPAFNHRRNVEQQLQNYIKSIKERLNILLPYLENYFSVQEVNEDDETFIGEVILWNVFEKDTFQRNEQYNVGDIIEKVFLSDANQENIQKEIDGMKFQGDVIQQNQSKANKIKIKENKLKLVQIKQQYYTEKKIRIDNLIDLASKYVQLRKEYLEETFWEAETSVEEIINKNLPDNLRLYLQQEQQFTKESLVDEFQVLRSRLFLPVTNFLATQILGGIV